MSNLYTHKIILFSENPKRALVVMANVPSGDYAEQFDICSQFLWEPWEVKSVVCEKGNWELYPYGDGNDTDFVRIERPKNSVKYVPMDVSKNVLRIKAVGGSV